MTETPDLVRAPVAPDPLDVVPQVLDLVRLTGAIFFRYDFHAPWAYWSPRTLEIEGAIPPGAGSLVMFHIVDRGSCWVALDDGVRHPLSAGDVVVLPYGDAHSFGSDEPAEAVPITSILPSTPWVEFPHLRYGGDGEDTHMVCGYLRGDAVLFDPVLRALPPLIVVRPTSGPVADWVRASVDYAVVRALLGRPPIRSSPNGGSISLPGCCARPISVSPRSPRRWATPPRRRSAAPSSAPWAWRPRTGAWPSEGTAPASRARASTTQVRCGHHHSTVTQRGERPGPRTVQGRRGRSRSQSATSNASSRDWTRLRRGSHAVS